MDKKVVKNSRIGEQYFEIKHPTGLTILVWEMDGFTNTEALFATKYGSINTRFKTAKDSSFIDVPEGIAHFLEHKLFENEDTDVFELYAKTGANGNAYTSFDQTAYLFSCTDNVKQSLEILLSFVQQPFFTDETVNKEQGIIGQEIKMSEDRPERQVFFNLLKAMYKRHSVRIDIAGTVDSISKIDAELLYKCYYAFYNLSNMVLVVAGNVKADEVLEVADKILKPTEDIGLITEFADEPIEVYKKEITAVMEVGTPIFNIGFKVEPTQGLELVRQETISSLLLQLVAGSTSDLYKQLFDEGLINSSFSTETFTGDGYFANIIGGESKDPYQVLNRVLKEIDRVKIEGLDKENFEIIKKSRYGSMIRAFNNAEFCSSQLLSSYFEGINAFDVVEVMADISFEDIQGSIDKLLNKDRVSISVIKAD